jgi:hypothetical protein
MNKNLFYLHVFGFGVNELNFYIAIFFSSAYLLIFLITSLGFATFSISVTTPQFRCQVTGLLLLTSVNFRWIITQRLPSVSYLTLIDKYTIGCLFCLATIFIWHAIIGSKVITTDASLLSIIDGYVLYGLAGLYVIFKLVMITWGVVLAVRVYRFKKKHGMMMIEKENARLDKKRKDDETYTGGNDATAKKKGQEGKDINSSKTEIMQYDELEKSRGKAYNNKIISKK